MAIYLGGGVLLAFRLPFGDLDRMWMSIVMVPYLRLFYYAPGPTRLNVDSVMLYM